MAMGWNIRLRPWKRVSLGTSHRNNFDSFWDVWQRATRQDSRKNRRLETSNIERPASKGRKDGIQAEWDGPLNSPSGRELSVTDPFSPASGSSDGLHLKNKFLL